MYSEAIYTRNAARVEKGVNGPGFLEQMYKESRGQSTLFVIGGLVIGIGICLAYLLKEKPSYP